MNAYAIPAPMLMGYTAEASFDFAQDKSKASATRIEFLLDDNIQPEREANPSTIDSLAAGHWSAFE